MGKITNMQRHQENFNIKAVKNTRKPKMKQKGIKGFLTLIGPNSNKYRLSKQQRNKQLAGRVGIGVATIAAALGLYSEAAISNVHTENVYTSETSSLSATNFERNESIADAKEKLLDILYHDLDSHKKNAQISFVHDDERDTDSIVVSEKQNYQKQPKEKFRYTKYNRLEDFMIKDKNCKEISEWLNLVIDAYYNENISKEDLRNLDGVTLNINDKKFKLDNNVILGESELDKDFER